MRTNTNGGGRRRTIEIVRRDHCSSPLLAAAIVAVLFCTFCVRFAKAQPTTLPVVESVVFPTTQAMPTARIAPNMAALAVMVEQSVTRLGEGKILQAAVVGAPGPLGLTADQSTALRRGFRDVYGAIAADPLFAQLPSALPQAVSQDAARPGHYFLYAPSRLEPNARVIVFLHGFGGNFQFYLWLLKSAFPEDLIICPSYGIAWSRDGGAYLDEVLTHVAQRFDIADKKPWLMPISAGGPAGFSIYSAAPVKFSGLICLASCPEEMDIAALRGNMKILMVYGAKDDRFPVEHVRAAVAKLRERVRRLSATEFAAADHFFLLTMPKETFEAIREFIAK